MRPPALLLAALGTSLLEAIAAPLAIDLTVPVPAAQESPYGPGAARNPKGGAITADNRSFFLAGKPWMPVVGEFHYSRYPRGEWRDALFTMKAGGIDTVSTYVFWIHHEEERGKFDWNGRRSLRDFLELCQEVGLKAIVRLGPWCHGEARNGGFPDWVQNSGTKLRSTDPAFLALVEPLYAEEARQMKGLLWKDGGPVIAAQVDNESSNAAYLLALKKMARASGIDVPFYTITGWQGGVPDRELIPLFGGYADGFWGGTVEKYRREYIFSDIRAINDMGAQLESLNPRNAARLARFPYACAEIGAGMMSSEKKRIDPDPEDIAALALTKLGSGSNMPGYYMYHGGTNPDAKHSTLQEERPNFMPLKDYDFQTALGSAGQLRQQYHLLRQQHVFLQDYGPQLARMTAFFPEKRPSDLKDFETLRWSMRSDGRSGFLFFCNRQPYVPMPAKAGVQFAVKTAGGTQLVPAAPLTIPSGSYGIWPVNLDCAGVTLEYATAQLLCSVADGNDTTFFFAELPGIAPELAFAAKTKSLQTGGTVEASAETLRVRNFQPGTSPAATITKADGANVRFVVLTPAQARNFWRAIVAGRPRALLTAAVPLADSDCLRLLADARSAVTLAIFPRVPGARTEQPLIPSKDGIFQRFQIAEPLPAAETEVKAVLEKSAGADAANLALSDEAAWKQAAVYRLEIPKALANRRVLLDLDYVGNGARLTLDGRLLDDHFFNGDTFAIALWRIPQDQWPQLRFLVLPASDAVVAKLPAAGRSKFTKAKAAGTLDSVAVSASEQREIRVRF